MVIGMEKKSTDQLMNQAIQLAKNGSLSSASRIFAAIINQDPGNETAWLWMAASITDREKQRYCLQRAIQINPKNERARNALAQLSVNNAPPSKEQHTPTAVGIPATGSTAHLDHPASPRAVSNHSQVRSSEATMPIRRPPITSLPKTRDKKNIWLMVLQILGIIIVLGAILYLVWLNYFQNPPPASTNPVAFVENPTIINVTPNGVDLAGSIQFAPAGTTLHLDPGIYIINQQLDLVKPIQMVGAGIDQTHVILQGTGITFRGNDIGIFSMSGIDIRYDGDKAADVIVVENGAIEFADCRIAGGNQDVSTLAGGRGLVLQGKSSGKISRCEITNNDAAGINISGQANPNILGNLIHQNGTGILINGSAMPIIENNTISENIGSGIVYADLGMGKSNQNQITDNKGSGIAIIGKSSPVIYKNISLRNQAFGIQVNGPAKPMLLGNTVMRNNKAGIGYFDASGGAAQENICSENDMHGISVNDQAQPEITQNICQRNKQVGIDFWGSSGGTASNNVCSENGLQGISVHQNAAPAIRNNFCNKNNDSGIVYWENAAGTADNNDCSQNLMNGISIHDQAKPSITRNTCQNNQKIGIAFYEKSAGEARQNECKSNGSNIIIKLDQANPILADNQCTAP
jgi:parallel beta-helix repeat protein